MHQLLEICRVLIQNGHRHFGSVPDQRQLCLLWVQILHTMIGYLNSLACLNLTVAATHFFRILCPVNNGVLFILYDENIEKEWILNHCNFIMESQMNYVLRNEILNFTFLEALISFR